MRYTENMRFLLPAAALLFIALSGCYTILEHPEIEISEPEADYTCTDCHDPHHDLHFEEPYGDDPWWFYYEMPWWYNESFYFSYYGEDGGFYDDVPVRGLYGDRDLEQRREPPRSRIGPVVPPAVGGEGAGEKKSGDGTVKKKYEGEKQKSMPREIKKRNESEQKEKPKKKKKGSG